VRGACVVVCCAAVCCAVRADATHARRTIDPANTRDVPLPQALKDAGVDFVVAPYEADAQMAYLALQGDVHAVITEDSDLLVYGCPRVLYKLDKYGHGEEILLEDLVLNQGISFVGFSHEMFSMVCAPSASACVEAQSGPATRCANAHMVCTTPALARALH
jgi:exonuclease-1